MIADSFLEVLVYVARCSVGRIWSMPDFLVEVVFGELAMLEEKERWTGGGLDIMVEATSCLADCAEFGAVSACCAAKVDESTGDKDIPGSTCSG